MFTEKEETVIHQITNRVQQLRQVLTKQQIPEGEDVLSWYQFLAEVKKVQGNLNNDLSFVATLMVKQFLDRNFEITSFDAAKKAQGAPGLDIDVYTKDNVRIVGEIKTTYPYGENDLGANQQKSFKQDFSKLHTAQADFKFFFLTEKRTFDLMKMEKYKCQISGVQVVLLTTEEQFTA